MESVLLADFGMNAIEAGCRTIQGCRSHGSPCTCMAGPKVTDLSSSFSWSPPASLTHREMIGSGGTMLFVGAGTQYGCTDPPNNAPVIQCKTIETLARYILDNLPYLRNAKFL